MVCIIILIPRLTELGKAALKVNPHAMVPYLGDRIMYVFVTLKV